ncbi:MAG TPA: hypothetical protein VK206_17445 [Anaerolineales bacterium]|nr:hypothetical protein [Anaerolineales bacterium]HLO27639.1 hypothetical protein [Anaerolineales bacterium]
MQYKTQRAIMSSVLVLILVSLACAKSQPIPTNTPESIATNTTTPTNTPRPSPTPRPTRTPNLTATQHVEELSAEVQAYFEKGYLATTDGSLIELGNFTYDWAQLGWYNRLPLRVSASDFFLSAHFKWNSAFQNSGTSGCGFIFDLQENDDHYAVFLDRTKVFFLITDHTRGYSRPVSPTRGSGLVKFDYPAEADFTLIVKGAYAYVLVNGEDIGEYTLAQSRSLRGDLGLTVLSGTNRGYGTHCEMTNLHLWIPTE